MTLLTPGRELTLRPMKYPGLYRRYKDAVANTWVPEEVDFSRDYEDLRDMPEAERRAVRRLVAYFASVDNIVADGVSASLYANLRAPEARLYLARQLWEEANHEDAYMLLADTLIPDSDTRLEAFSAVHDSPVLEAKADFAYHHMSTDPAPREVMRTMACFAACIEGLGLWSAFALVFHFRDIGRLSGLCTVNDWIARDETGHLGFEFEVLKILRREHPDAWDGSLQAEIREMVHQAVSLEEDQADWMLEGVSGLTPERLKSYIRYIAAGNLNRMGIDVTFDAPDRQPLDYMDLFGLDPLTNFFEATVTEYVDGVSGSVRFNADF